GPAFARRVASVLGRLPAGSLGQSTKYLLEHNELARLFFQGALPALLEEPRAVRDLLEAPEIHAQLLALRALGQDDERARRLAAENLDLLQATLLRDLHRKSRLVALPALANAATTPDNARTILEKAARLGLSTNLRRPVRFHARVKERAVPLRLALQALGEVVWSDDMWSPQAEFSAFLLDPIITVHPDRVFFEAFSNDQSTYGLVIADRELFEP